MYAYKVFIEAEVDRSPQVRGQLELPTEFLLSQGDRPRLQQTVFSNSSSKTEFFAYEMIILFIRDELPGAGALAFGKQAGYGV